MLCSSPAHPCERQWPHLAPQQHCRKPPQGHSPLTLHLPFHSWRSSRALQVFREVIAPLAPSPGEPLQKGRASPELQARERAGAQLQPAAGTER